MYVTFSDSMYDNMASTWKEFCIETNSVCVATVIAMCIIHETIICIILLVFHVLSCSLLYVLPAHLHTTCLPFSCLSYERILLMWY